MFHERTLRAQRTTQKMIITICSLIVFGVSLNAVAKPVSSTSYLVKFDSAKLSANKLVNLAQKAGGNEVFAQNKEKVEFIGGDWAVVNTTRSSEMRTLSALQKADGVLHVQPNYKLSLLENYRIEDPLRRAAFAMGVGRTLARVGGIKDNPEVPAEKAPTAGTDPLVKSQWGLDYVNVQEAWKKSIGSPEVIIAVIDTGVDYTHEDLAPSLWRNPGETGTDANGKNKANNGIDDDKNGYVDDVVGWDFATNDNLPWDLYVEPYQLLIGGGNPGHGTHCAGTIVAKDSNNMGIRGMASQSKLMILRFITEKGSGTTADAVKSIRYAVDNGAKILSNSWGSEGEDPADGENNLALREAIRYAESKNVLFVAAAGNSSYDSDHNKNPIYPASYDNENIIAVAAHDKAGAMASFSNWGERSVDIAAPGVAIFSTMAGGTYSDYVFNMGGYEITWDGTSMAAPHVAGAAALILSANPQMNVHEIKQAILSNAKKMDSMTGKVLTGGVLSF